jgi:hypothetical protein
MTTLPGVSVFYLEHLFFYERRVGSNNESLTIFIVSLLKDSEFLLVFYIQFNSVKLKQLVVPLDYDSF